MCERNAQIHAETIWKSGWNEQLSIHCAQKSPKTCGQRSDRQCPAQCTRSTEHEINVAPVNLPGILASSLDRRAGASWVPAEQITYLWKPESCTFSRPCLNSTFSFWVVFRVLTANNRGNFCSMVSFPTVNAIGSAGGALPVLEWVKPREAVEFPLQGAWPSALPDSLLCLVVQKETNVAGAFKSHF